MKKLKKPDLTSGLKTRTFRVGGYSVAASVIVIAIAIVINIIVSALPSSITQIDVTSSQMFSISEETEKVLDQLNSDVQIYWIVQSGQESDTLGLLLNRYTSGNSHIKVTKKDPDVSPAFVQQYFSGSIYNNSLVVVGDNERYRTIGYDDIYIYDYSNYYSTGTADITFNGEAEITSAISYVTSGTLMKMYTLTGHGEGTLSSTFQSAVEKQNIETESLSLLTMENVPGDADCILIYNPNTDISDDESVMLEDYLATGGKIMLITDPLQDGEDLTRLQVLLSDYGVTMVDGIVIESDTSYYYGKGYPYYLLPELESHKITTPLISSGYYVLLPLAHGLQISDSLPDGITVDSLLATSDSAFSKIAGYSSTTYEKEDGDIDGPFSLGVAISDSNTGAQIVWVSSAALVDDTANSYVSGGNQDLFLNGISWMTGNEDSLTIHAKTVTNEYLTLSSSTSSIYSILIVGVIPILYLGVGIVIWSRRKRR